MLLFIELADCLDCDEICFNTSHVTLYQDYPAADRSENIVSIHLMLLFITAEGVKVDLSNVFQYISCYSLSLRQIQLQTLISRFNTSHVTLYLFTGCLESPVVSFQYISCYSLSHSPLFFFFPLKVSIHLMLLFICISKHSIRAFLCFNTSHVTLYL